MSVPKNTADTAQDCTSFIDDSLSDAPETLERDAHIARPIALALASSKPTTVNHRHRDRPQRQKYLFMRRGWAGRDRWAATQAACCGISAAIPQQPI
eukprot:jgi/Tetstr1/444789/TSEL_032637.t1